MDESEDLPSLQEQITDILSSGIASAETQNFISELHQRLLEERKQEARQNVQRDITSSRLVAAWARQRAMLLPAPSLQYESEIAVAQVFEERVRLLQQFLSDHFD